MLMLMTTSLATMLNLAPGPWLVINDDVMGGRSTASVDAFGAGLRFEGELSLENNGGFSSTRRLLNTPPAGADGVRIEVRGNGRDYQFRLRQDQRFNGVAWRAPFSTSEDWQVIELRFADFEPVFRGQPVPEAGPADPANVNQVSFMISDRREGHFELEVRRLEFFSEGS